MHGRVKVRTTAEQEALKKIERTKKVAQYRAGIDLILRKRKEEVWDEEVLLVTEQMLLQNPDIYTLWNVRREAFGAIKWSSEEEHTEQLKKELTLTEHCLRANPKSYSVWHQRCWVNDRLAKPDWETELSLCAKCLNLDERNFHCWDYRRYVVKKSAVPEEDEFNFSTTKIESNFSNYSSWHYRSLILPKMFPDEAEELPIRKDKHTEELDLVMNATFTDPNDTSAWFYQRWLLGVRQTFPQTLWRITVTPDRVLIAFNRQVLLTKENTVLKLDGHPLALEFKSHNHKRFSNLWSAALTTGTNNLTKNSIVQIAHDGVDYNLERSSDEDAWIYESESLPEQKHDVAHLTGQLENYKQLAQIEPDNKWVLLTGIILMKNIDPVTYHETILEDLSALAKIDKKRVRYYSDLRSKYVIDFALYNSGGLAPTKLDLSCTGLTTLYREQCFAFAEEIHLAGNELANSLHKLSAFRSCVKLSLSSNAIRSVCQFPVLESLRYLSLRNNNLCNVEEVLDLVRRNRLTELDLRDNPVAAAEDLVSQLAVVSPLLRVYSND